MARGATKSSLEASWLVGNTTQLKLSCANLRTIDTGKKYCNNEILWFHSIIGIGTFCKAQQVMQG